MAVAAALVVVGVLAFFLQPGAPDSECADDPNVTSGFVDEEKDCPISIESWEEISDYESSPKLFRIAGLLLIVAGVIVGIVALVVRPRRSNDGGPQAT